MTDYNSMKADEYAQKVRDLSDLRSFQSESGKSYAMASGDVGPDVQAFMTSRMEAIGRIVDRRDIADGIMLGDLMTRRFKAIMCPEKHDTSICVYTGIEPLDRKMGVMRGGNVLLIGAHSGVGKTSLATNMAVKIAGAPARLCANCGSNMVGVECDACQCQQERLVRNCVAFFSPEMTEDELHDRIVFSESRAKMPYVDQFGRTHLPPGSAEKVAANAKQLAALPIKIYCDVFDMVSLRLRAMSYKRAVEKDGDRLAAVVIDYLQLMYPGGQDQKKSMNREQEVAAVSRMAKKLAKKLGCVVILLAQLNDESRSEKRKPKMGDIRESKAPAFDASKVVLIYNPVMEERIHQYIDEAPPETGIIDCADLIIAKCRGGGRTGVVRVAFFPEFTLFDTWPEGEPMPENKVRSKDDDEGGKGRR